METYLIWCPDMGEDEEDGDRVEVHTAMDGVEQWARDLDLDGCRIVDTGNVYIVCTKDDTGVAKSFSVSGDMVPVYYVDPVND